MNYFGIKTLLHLQLFAFVVSPCDVFIKDFVSGKHPGFQDVKQLSKVSFSDTCGNRLRLLSFNTEMQELAPAIRNGYLYYIVSGEPMPEYRIFLVEPENNDGLSVLGKKRVGKKEIPGILKNVYLNFSLDGETVLLNTIDEKSGSKGLYTGNSVFLSDIKKLEAFPYNDKNYSLGRATLSPDGKLMVFSSDMPDSFGGVDLWVSRLENGRWVQPVNLGDSVNTALNEAMPYFISNTRLYFSSEGHAGFGGFDLFYTDLEEGRFSSPVNMGSPVNSESNETGLCYSPESGTYYFASDRRGNYDIYSYSAAVLVIPDEKPATESQAIENLSPLNGTPDIQAKMQFVSDTVSEKNGRFVDAGLVIIDKEKELIIPQKIETEENKYFYALQLMALKPETYAREYFRKILDSKKKYFVVHEDDLIKIRTGRFSSYREAYKYATDQRIEAFYIVRMTESQIGTYL